MFKLEIFHIIGCVVKIVYHNNNTVLPSSFVPTREKRRRRLTWGTWLDTDGNFADEGRIQLVVRVAVTQGCRWEDGRSNGGWIYPHNTNDPGRGKKGGGGVMF
jgi:hypothetical protein